MAIKRVAILIQIDAGEQERSCFSMRSDTNGGPDISGADETYIVSIHNSSIVRTHNVFEAPNRDEMLDCAAHEIGHVLSGVFELPGGIKDDPRTGKEITSWNKPTPEQIQRILASERLAWDIGEKVRPQLNKAGRDKALSTYSPEHYDEMETESGHGSF